jgi:ABC-type branched-subunit amino acid transport system ATPase component
VDDVSFRVKRRSIHALIGPNGAGKTTTLSIVNGTARATSGQVLFEGGDVTNLSADKIAQLGVARTFQNIKLFPSLTVLENIMVGGQFRYTKGGIMRYLLNVWESGRFERQMREKAAGIARSIGLGDLLYTEVGSLAYGRQKVTELGRALMLDPKIVLLDEPAAGLNPTERAEFIGILQKTFDSGVDFLLIEHNMDIVMNISNHITVLSFGKKIAEGTPGEIQNNEEVIRSYLGDDYLPIIRGKGTP